MSGCWLWTGYVNRRFGYGVAWNGIKDVSAHRLSWTLHRGEIPCGIHVLHKCDNRGCVNPDHLFLGTNKDNVLDRVAKGRGVRNQARGERHGRATVREDDVLKIRELAASGVLKSVLARKFGLNASTVGDIVWRKSWRHI